MTRQQLRLLATAALLSSGVLLVVLGYRGWRIYNAFPLQIIGYMMLATAVLGVLGVNKWFGGPLDRRRDQISAGAETSRPVDPSLFARWEGAQSRVQDWGTTWGLVPLGSGLQRELDFELTPDHPLTGLVPVVFGRCRSCDDIVVALDVPSNEQSLAVVHLTWIGRPEQQGWPSFERLTTVEFHRRFLVQGEHS